MARRAIFDTPRTARTNPPTVPDGDILYQLPGTTPELARILGMSVSGIYQRLRRLYAEGVVRRDPNKVPTVWVRTDDWYWWEEAADES